MPYYTSTEQFYANLRALFACVAASYPRSGEAIAAARMVIRLRTTAPAGEIVINGQQRPVQTTFGANGVRADLDIDLTADTLHRILLGELSLTKALGSGQLKVRGPIWKTLALSELFTVGQRCYPGVLQQAQQTGR